MTGGNTEKAGFHNLGQGKDISLPKPAGPPLLPKMYIKVTS